MVSENQQANQTGISLQEMKQTIQSPSAPLLLALKLSIVSMIHFQRSLRYLCCYNVRASAKRGWHGEGFRCTNKEDQPTEERSG